MALESVRMHPRPHRDGRAAPIARRSDAADVVSALMFARELGLDLAVRGGGHNGPGLGTVEGGVVIDLKGMKGVRVDPAAGTVRVSGGATLGDVDHATSAFGLACRAGSSRRPASAASHWVAASAT